jgi:hypothetical protein
MKNPFEKPEEVERFLKIAVEGEPGTGKTIFGLLGRFYGLGKVAIASGEAGDLHYLKAPDDATQEVKDFIDKVKPDGRLQTQSIESLEDGISYIEQNPDEFGVLVIDTATGIYEALIEAKMGDSGELSMEEWGPIKRKFKSLMTRLVNLHCSIIWVVHTNEITRKGKGMATEVVGTKADVEKTFSRNPDVRIRLEMRGKKRFAVVLKDRTRSGYHAGDEIEDPNIGLWTKSILAGKKENLLTPAELKAVNEGIFDIPVSEEVKVALERLRQGFASKEEKKTWATEHKEWKDGLSEKENKLVGAAFKAAATDSLPASTGTEKKEAA